MSQLMYTSLRCRHDLCDQTQCHQDNGKKTLDKQRRQNIVVTFSQMGKKHIVPEKFPGNILATLLKMIFRLSQVI